MDEEAKEVVLIGMTDIGRQVILLGTSGDAEAWRAACGVADVLGPSYISGDTVVVDVACSSVRPARLARFANGQTYEVRVTDKA